MYGLCQSVVVYLILMHQELDCDVLKIALFCDVVIVFFVIYWLVLLLIEEKTMRICYFFFFLASTIIVAKCETKIETKKFLFIHQVVLVSI